jgi:AmmeMemoRadiSam system protein A
MMVEEFTRSEQLDLLSIARQTIQEYLKSSKKKYPSYNNSRFLSKRGVFVTLHRKGALRGCIGYPLPEKPLLEAVVDNAIASATQDPRFDPVTLEELKDIDIEISVLTVPMEIKNVQDVVIGRDGIIISKGFYRGLLLPQVPIEQKWNREQYLSYGCLKAGLESDEWKRGIKIETFQALVFGEKDFAVGDPGKVK